MAYKVKGGYQSYRSSDFDEVQGYDDLRMIWKAIRESETGKRPPLRDEVKAKIVRGLEITMYESTASRTRNVAAAMIIAIEDRAWDRDVYRKPNPHRFRMARPKRT